jgi:predicted flap endonuclease-1-like 5' DNA nuclease
MKKARNKEINCLKSNDLPTIINHHTSQVFLVLGLILIIIYLINSHSTDWPDNETSVDPPIYAWINDTSLDSKGLYLIDQDHLKNFQPISQISAFQQDGTGRLEPVPIPAHVANIFFKPIPINRADKEILCTLPGIGPVMAERILARREAIGGFKRIDELQMIQGIGPKKLALLRAHISFN